MTGRSGITENDLHAFADGELDAAASAEIEAWLATHPDDAKRVRELRSQCENLHSAFDDVLGEPTPAPLVALLTGRSSGGRAAWWSRAAAAALLFAVGLGAGWLLHGFQGSAEADAFLQTAFSAHVVHVAEKRHAVEVQAREERHLVAWLSRRLEHPIKAPVLISLGYRLVGGRLIADTGNPAAQFMYENSGGQRITIYARRTGETGETKFHFVRDSDISAFYWVEAPLAFALVGTMNRAKLLPVAKLVYKELEDELKP